MTCAGATLSDGIQDKWYKQRGIHGSLKASVPNKSYKEKQAEWLSDCGDEDQPCEVRSDWTKPGWSHVWRYCFSGTGNLPRCPVFSPSLSLSLCSGASWPVCSLLSVSSCLSFKPFVGQPVSGWNLTPSFSSQSYIVFYSKSPDKWFRKNWLFLRGSAEVWRIWPSGKESWLACLTESPQLLADPEWYPKLFRRFSSLLVVSVWKLERRQRVLQIPLCLKSSKSCETHSSTACLHQKNITVCWLLVSLHFYMLNGIRLFYNSYLRV